ncbi:hypothetical protein RYX36_006580 [Vicia faba]
MTSSQIFVMVTLASLLISSNALLTPHFYDKVCPQALPVIKSVVKEAILKEKRIGASLLRLHFHDCFVNNQNIISTKQKQIKPKRATNHLSNSRAITPSDYMYKHFIGASFKQKKKATIAAPPSGLFRFLRVTVVGPTHHCGSVARLIFYFRRTSSTFSMRPPLRKNLIC